MLYPLLDLLRLDDARAKHLSIAVLLNRYSQCHTKLNTLTQQMNSIAPVVLFPAFHFTKLLVSVDATSVATAYGSFENCFAHDDDSPSFPRTLRNKLLTLEYNPTNSIPMSQRFCNARGVHTSISGFPTACSAPFYEPLYTFLEQRGYTRDENILVAGYDSRLTPDMDNFVSRTKLLVEQAYSNNMRVPVHLISHSNGSCYALHFLREMDSFWKTKFIHGFTSIAGNWTGQGSTYAMLFCGLNIKDFAFPTDAETAATSARMFRSHPATYMSASDPEVFRDVTILVVTGRQQRYYKASQNLELFKDASISNANDFAHSYSGFMKILDPQKHPGVDVFIEIGTGLKSHCCTILNSLDEGQVFDPMSGALYSDGDGNQENRVNYSIIHWSQRSEHGFSLSENFGVTHLDLPFHPDVLDRLISRLSSI
jgi:lecithin-cholesterol acyltransferase